MKLENKYLELKETNTKTYLKTISAFANYNDGEIRFGIDDNGKVKPIKDLNAFALNIENQINDSFIIKPSFSIVQNSNQTISVFVKKGFNTPYLYNGKAYKRSDTSTVEVDQYELRRLYLEGSNQTFDEISCPEKNLTFNVLKNQLFIELHLSKFDDDTLISLNLLKNGVFNNAASLLSDTNKFPGIDVAVFGENSDIIKERYSFVGVSLITQFYKLMEIFERTYVFEEIKDVERKKVELIPRIAFREIIANAIVHRTYDLPINTKVSMFKDGIKISSPGGLMFGLSKEKFLNGAFSVLRNPIVASVFNRINIIEAFATSIQRTNRVYEKYNVKPTIDIQEDMIEVTLPLITATTKCSMQEFELISQLNPHIKYTRSELETLFNLSKDRLLKRINSLVEHGLLIKEGEGRSTKYYLK